MKKKIVCRDFYFWNLFNILLLCWLFLKKVNGTICIDHLNWTGPEQEHEQNEPTDNPQHFVKPDGS